MDRLRAKVGFHWDAGGLYCEALDFTNDYPIEEDLCNLAYMSLQELGLEGIDRSRSYTSDFTIEFSKSWTDCGYEYDSYYTFTNVKEIVGIL